MPRHQSRMGFLLRTFACVALLVALVAGAALALARRDDVSAKIEKFTAEGSRVAYDVGSTVAVVAAYRAVYKKPPGPADVRKAYDEMLGMGLEVDKTTATRFFREREKIDREAASPPERFMSTGPPASKSTASRDPEEKERASRDPAPKSPSSKNIAPKEPVARTPDDSEDDGDRFESDADDDYDGEGGEGFESDGSGEDGFESGSGKSVAGAAGSSPLSTSQGGGPSGSRRDPFLASVSAELVVLRDRIAALSLAVGEKVDGSTAFAPAGREEVRGREVALGAAHASSPAPARFEDRDNDNDGSASLARPPGSSVSPGSPASARSDAGMIEGFYSPW